MLNTEREECEAVKDYVETCLCICNVHLRLCLSQRKLVAFVKLYNSEWLLQQLDTMIHETLPRLVCQLQGEDMWALLSSGVAAMRKEVSQADIH